MNCTALRLPLVSLLCLSSACFAEDIQTIGTFTGTFAGEPIELHSVFEVADEWSDLTFQEDFGIKTYRVSASLDGSQPILNVVLQEGSVAGDLSIVDVTVIDGEYDKALSATHSASNGVTFESYGAINVETLSLEADGTIDFEFTADLIRFDLETGTPLPDEPQVQIEGQFSGVFPASELGG